METSTKPLTSRPIKIHKKITLLFIFMCATFQISAPCAANTMENDIMKRYHIYRNKFLSSNDFFKNNLENQKNEIEKEDNDAEPEQYRIQGDASAWFWNNPIRLKIFVNNALYHHFNDEKYNPHLLPQLTINQALEKGKQYLKEFEISPIDDIELKTITFNRGWQECWLIEWGRKAGEYSWDDFDKTLREELSIIFHEKYGFVRIENSFYSPPPKKLVVKITKEQAILKASLCAPLVFKTSLYRQARASGFVITGMNSCELKVAIPNWLLDPKQAWWPRNHPPTETRLCWLVKFTTVDSKAVERKTKDGALLRLVSPEILIYLDAETGECVGASCT